MTFWPNDLGTPLVPLKHVCSIDPEILPESTEPDQRLNYVDIGNVTLEEGITGHEVHTFREAPSRARKIVRRGDTIVSTVRTYLRAIAHIETSAPEYIVSTGFAVVRPKTSVDPRYLHRIVQSEPFVESVVAHSTGVSYPAITSNKLGNLVIPLPDLRTQQRIADFLDRETARIDELIKKKQSLIGELQDYELALITITTAGGRMQARDYGVNNGSSAGQGEEAVWVPLRRFVSEITNGTTATQIDYVEGAARVSRIETISDGAINFQRVGFVARDLALYKYRLMPGDILFSHINSLPMIGNCAQYDGEQELYVGMNLLRLRPADSIHPRFLYWSLQNTEVRNHIWQMAKPAINQASVSISNLKRVSLPYHDLSVQVKIAKFLDRKSKLFEVIHSKTRESIMRLRELRSALITAAVTGQIDMDRWQQRGETARSFDEVEAEVAGDLTDSV